MQRAGFPEATIIPQAHLFVIFFSAFASITPPTAPTSYATAAIAQSPIMPTAIEAMKLALPAFLLPYMFILDPSLLMLGTPLQIAVGALFAIAGVAALAAALQAFAYGPLNPLKRLLFFAGGVVMIGPTLTWHLSGAVLAGGVLLWQRLRWEGRPAVGAGAEAQDARGGGHRAVDVNGEPGDKTAMTPEGRPGT